MVEPNAPVVGCPKIDLFAAKDHSVRVIERRRDLKLTSTESPRAERTCLRLLGSSTKGSRGLRLRLAKGSSTGPKSTGTCGCSAYEMSAMKTGLGRDTRTESAAGGLLTEGRVTCTKKTTCLLLLRLRGTESASPEPARLLWLSLTERSKPGPRLLLLLLWLLLLLLLAKSTEPCSGSGTGRSKSASTTTEGRLSRLCCGLGLAEQPPRRGRLCRRCKRTGTESSRGGCLTVLLVVLQPEFLRRAKSVRE